MTLIREPIEYEPVDKIKVSVVIPARNEYPQILGTILNITEELEFWGYQYEFVIVSNQSNDGTPEVIMDRFRHWINEQRIKVIEFNEKPACWDARNVGIKNSTGNIVIVCDAHMSVAVGTLHNLVQYCYKYGGVWHSASQMWGDSNHVRLYGYLLKLEEKFWGNLSRHIPPDVFDSETGKPSPYTIPMAQYSLFVISRADFNEVRGFHPEFRCYGGGEPYLALKMWLYGKKCWMYPQGLVRHAFGLRHEWREVTDVQRLRGMPFVFGKGIRGKNRIEIGDKVSHYSRGYGWNNRQVWFNFLLAAYCIGGEKWIKQRYDMYVPQCKGVGKYLEELDELYDEALEVGKEDRDWIESHQIMSLDELIDTKPWEDYASVI